MNNRFISFIANPTAYSLLVLASTISTLQAGILRDYMQRYVSHQVWISVSLVSC